MVGRAERIEKVSEDYMKKTGNCKNLDLFFHTASPPYTLEPLLARFELRTVVNCTNTGAIYFIIPFFFLIPLLQLLFLYFVL